MEAFDVGDDVVIEVELSKGGEIWREFYMRDVILAKAEILRDLSG